MIEVESLSKNYGEIRALDNLSFRVETGEVLGFLGPNGAGKTTAMRILTGYLTPTGGTARINGIDVVENSLQARKRIGYLPESVPLYRDMIVDDYLSYVAALKETPHKYIKNEVDRVCDSCGLNSVRNRIVGKLSKGFRQRVGLAQALIGDPELLILDEPTEGLDPKQIIEIRNLINELSGNKTVILSTHILPEVSMTCQRVIIINKGKLIAVDTPENLNSSLQKHSTISVTVEKPDDRVVDLLESVTGVTSVRKMAASSASSEETYEIDSGTDVDIRTNIAGTIVRNGYGLLELKSRSLSLEDIFIQLVTEEEVEEI